MTNDRTEVSAATSYRDNSAFWVAIIRRQLDRYRTELTDAAVLHAAAIRPGLRVLDAGCGEGYMSRLAHAAGAVVAGIDQSAGLIEAARTLAHEERRDIEYHCGDVVELPYEDASFDLVIANHLVNDLPSPAQVFREFARVLTPGGRLTILMLHPCFHRQDALADALPSAQSYFIARPYTKKFRVAGIESPSAVTAWTRPLEDYTDALAEAGFHIRSLREPRPTPHQLATDPWWQANFSTPRFMLITAHRDVEYTMTPG